MAEAAGLALGVAGLAGLFGACFQMFELFELGSNHGKDYEIFLGKLKVEKVRFLLWGEGAGVWKMEEQAITTETHENLRRPVVLDAVVTIFSAMRAAFVDTTRLIDQYTLEPTQSNGLVTTWGVGPTNIAATVEGSYLDFLSRIKAGQEGAKFSSKLRWASRDKKLADDLIATIRGFNNSLVDIVPVSGKRRLRIQDQGNASEAENRYGLGQLQGLGEDFARTSITAGMLGFDQPPEFVPMVVEKSSLPTSETNPFQTPLTRTNRSPQSHSGAHALTPGLPNAGRQYMMAGAEQTGLEIHREFPPNCIRRIARELESFKCPQISPVSLSPIDDDNITICRANIEGPEHTPYADGVFHLVVTYTPEYPFKPPSIIFLTRIYHLNVDYNTGELCLERNIKGYWSPVLTAVELLQQIRALLVSPNLDEPFLPDVATLFKADRQGYERVARFYTETHAQPRKEGTNEE